MQHKAIYYNIYNLSQIFSMLQFQYVVCNRSHENPEPHGEDGNCKVQCSPGSIQAVRSHRTAVEISTTKVSRGNHGLTLPAVSDQCSDSSDILHVCVCFRHVFQSFHMFIYAVHTYSSYILKRISTYLCSMLVIFYCFSFARISVPSTCCQRYRLRGQCRVHLTVANMSSNLAD